MFLKMVPTLLCSTAITDLGHQALLTNYLPSRLYGLNCCITYNIDVGCTQALRHGLSPRQPYPADTSGVIREPGLSYL
jgi:hypothetical protein